MILHMGHNAYKEDIFPPLDGIGSEQVYLSNPLWISSIILIISYLVLIKEVRSSIIIIIESSIIPLVEKVLTINTSHFTKFKLVDIVPITTAVIRAISGSLVLLL